MLGDPNKVIDDSMNTEAERNEQFAKDRAAYERRNKETDLLIKQMENIKTIEKLAKEANHADRFKNIHYMERQELDPELKAKYD